MQTISGQCSCGKIAYHYPAPALQIVACHCGLCRRMTGAALSSYVVVKEAELVFTQGQELLKSYTVTSRTQRHFCTDCGTPLYNSNQETYAGLSMLYLGTVNQHESLSPRMDIYCENKLPWLSTADSSRHFEQTPRKP
ncbi:aldehyde-activating protein [Undibacterium sp. YM2]|uniref:GFA family protein n=1 Tax=Undibacterium sp. YM2 TaxID=2058625 RepID=UPI001331CA44|nr:GFA family protein [Undibacterium sp. YM2]BBB69939.1 aldehyde-activating protein [Undibacterium sp. YM2]